MHVIVLAAGASTRMISPKALTRLGGETALERIARAAAGWPLVVVLGEHHDEVRAALPTLAARFVRNPAPEAGRTGSLQLGLAASRAREALVLPVDHPLVRASTLQALAARPEPWVVPTFGGRGGHPLKLGPEGIEAVLGAPAEAPLRDVPSLARLAVTRVAVDDEGVLLNLDTPSDVDRALAGRRHA